MMKKFKMKLFLLAGCIVVLAAVVFQSCDDDDDVYYVYVEDTTVSTLAGSGEPDDENGQGTEASFDYPIAVVEDAQGNIYVADHDNHQIRMITPGGMVSAFAGTGELGAGNETDDGTVANAKFGNPSGIAIDPTSGAIYVAEAAFHRIRKIINGNVTTFAGSTVGYENGEGTDAKFNKPYGLTIDNQGNVYVADSENNRIRKITSAGVVSNLAGNGDADYENGQGENAEFDKPYGVDVDSEGNVYVADAENHRIRKITPSGNVSSFISGLSNPVSVALDGQNNVYVADGFGNRILKISQNEQITILAGNPTAGYDDGAGDEAGFFRPRGITANASGTLFYVADTDNNKIRKIVVD